MGNPQLPAKYQAARKALAAAQRIDEVKAIRDKAVAMAIYAKQARDGELIAWSTEIRKRAERRGGELIAQAREAGELAKGTRGSKIKGARVASGPTLPSQGVDKHLADRMRKAWAMSEDKFEAHVAKSVKIAVAAVENTSAVIREARAERHKEKKKKRQQREQALGAKQIALPQKRYGVILADPEWKFEFWSEKGATNSSAENHYDVSELANIKARDVASIAADDCVLFLWATVPMLPHALEVMAAWGFRYVSHYCWGKDKAGTGYWGRNKHELLLIGTRGKIPAPAEGEQPESLIIAPVSRHSAKPACFYDIIERLFPSLPKIELNARTRRQGWDSWGLEVPMEAVA
jgi:N6-adenosine-specific RNA methylase IME4